LSGKFSAWQRRRLKGDGKGKIKVTSGLLLGVWDANGADARKKVGGEEVGTTLSQQKITPCHRSIEGKGAEPRSIGRRGGENSNTPDECATGSCEGSLKRGRQVGGRGKVNSPVGGKKMAA